MTEKWSFSYFHGNHCQGNKFIHQDNAANQFELIPEKRSQTDKEFSRKFFIKVYHQGIGFLPFLFYLSIFYLLFNMDYFLNPLYGQV